MLIQQNSQYIDAAYAAFLSPSSGSKLLNVLNFQHKHIQFTLEKATESLNFLDVEIKRNDAEI